MDIWGVVARCSRKLFFIPCICVEYGMKKEMQTTDLSGSEDYYDQKKIEMSFTIGKIINPLVLY
jgi:hypothetical protein